MTRASGRSFDSDGAYKSLQMEMIGRKSGRWPLFFSFECAETCLEVVAAPKTFMLTVLLLSLHHGECDQLLNEPRGLQLVSESIRRKATLALTWSLPPVAPSISSIITSTGFLLPTFEPDSNAGRILSSTVPAERESLPNKLQVNEI